MNLDHEKHPADLKVSEIIDMILDYSQKMTNDIECETSLKSQHLPSRRSSINLDICYELNLREVRNHRSNRNVTIDPPKKCHRCDAFLLDKQPLYPTSMSMKPLGCEKELQFIRAVIWMKSAIKMMKRVFVSDIYEVFEGLSGIQCTKKSLQLSSGKNDQNHMITLSQITQESQLQDRCTLQKKYLIPDEEDARSDISNAMNFDEDHGNDSAINNVLFIDSGIIMFDSINTASDMNTSRVEHDKRNEPMTLTNIVKSSGHFEERRVNENSSSTLETISSASLANLIENLRLNNFVLGEIRIVLALLENDEMLKNYINNGAMIRNAIDTIVRFLNQLITENDMSSSAVYLQLCTDNIMATIRKVFSSKTHTNVTAAERQFQLMSIIGFCNCRKICEEVINLLLSLLTEMNEDFDDYDYEDPRMINDSEAHILCRVLQMSVNIYSHIVGPSRNMETNPHHNTMFIWRALWKNHTEYESSEFRARELELEWIRSMRNFFDPELSKGLSMFGDYRAISNAIQILSSPPLNQTCDTNFNFTKV